MASNGADVITNSWGFGDAVPITHSAIIDVTKPDGLGRDGKGCVVIDASGNVSRNRVRLIGRYPEVIAVGATDHNDIRCYYSSYGPELDIVAPSGPQLTLEDWLETHAKGALYTTKTRGFSHPLRDEIRGPQPHFPDDLDYGAFSGTSGAAPIAAGVVALILSVEPNLTSEEVRHFLCRSAKDLGEPGRDDYYGWGRVDARAAV
jgi:subtilisin family serine protease